MDRTPVKSSNIASIGFENETLEVEFKNGGVYTYDGVPEAVFSAMKAAPSVGSYQKAP